VWHVEDGKTIKTMLSAGYLSHFKQTSLDDSDVDKPAAKPAGIAGLSVRDTKPTGFSRWLFS